MIVPMRRCSAQSAEATDVDPSDFHMKFECFAVVSAPARFDDYRHICGAVGGVLCDKAIPSSRNTSKTKFTVLSGLTLGDHRMIFFRKQAELHSRDEGTILCRSRSVNDGHF